MVFKVGRCLLRDRLSDNHMQQTELADILGVTSQQINKYALNKQKMSIQTAKNIAYVLHCEIDDLYDWIEVGNNE